MAGVQMYILCGVVAYLAVLSVSGDRVCRHPFSRPHAQGYCGDKLTRALEFICSKVGYAHHGKRSEMPSHSQDSDDLEALSELSENEEELTNYYLKKAEELGALPNLAGSDQGLKEHYLDKREAKFFLNKRDKVKIVCECCYNKCSLQELSGYCSNPKLAYNRIQNRITQLFR